MGLKLFMQRQKFPLKWAALSCTSVYNIIFESALFWALEGSLKPGLGAAAAVCIIIPAGGHKSRHHLSYYVPMIQISAQMLSADTLSWREGGKHVCAKRELSFSESNSDVFFNTHAAAFVRIRA